MQDTDTFWRWIQRHWLLEAVAVMLLVSAVALVRWDQVTAVSYRRVPVVSVQQVPGSDMSVRAVVVDLGDRQRLVRTGDWMIRAQPGARVCIAERQLLLRRYVRVSLALAGYCGRLPTTPVVTGVSPG
ncbi:MAG TPA: hypothetical protein DIU07_14610 [Rhodobacteraceae bacterium]|nr:hypothetical protein [Paracoccaceae bacterium]